jgi:DNA-binding NtrC family response regulator
MSRRLKEMNDMKSKGKLFLVDDDELIVSVLSRALRKEGYELQSETDTDNVIDRIRSWDPDLTLLDISMPGRNGLDILQEINNSDIRTQVVMLTADDTASSAVKAMKLGAVDYLTKPFDTDEVKIVISNILEKESLKQEVTYLRQAYSAVIERDIVGNSHAIKDLKTKIEKMAQARVSTILITGESGTGKEIVSRYIHNAMFGNDGTWQAPFVSVNCAAMPESLLESELFGYEKGSFTDAKSSKKGLFEQAKGGIILLDEIGDMKLDLQSKLLRVLEERTIRPIGGKVEITVEFTAIATTSRNLSEAVSKGKFREDLFFRLSPFYFHIPPLRERKEDIPILAGHFLSFFSEKYKKTAIRDFAPETVQFMSAYRWPGNVRELKNLVERIVVLQDTEVITPEHLPRWIFGQETPEERRTGDRFILPASGISLEKVEKDLILQALEKANHKKTLAAKLLDISYDSLRYQLKKFGIK